MCLFLVAPVGEPVTKRESLVLVAKHLADFGEHIRYMQTIEKENRSWYDGGVIQVTVRLLVALQKSFWAFGYNSGALKKGEKLTILQAIGAILGQSTSLECGKEKGIMLLSWVVLYVHNSIERVYDRSMVTRVYEEALRYLGRERKYEPEEDEDEEC